MKIRILRTLTLLLIIAGCEKTADKKEAIQNSSNFRLANDFSDFPNKMEDGDTLYLVVNLSVSTWEEYDLIELTKTNDKTYLQIKEKVVMAEDTFYFPKKLYRISNGSIGLTDIIKNFDINNKDDINSPFFIFFNYKENDTILLRTTGLTDRINKIEKYQKFISALYPLEMQQYRDKYQTPPPPPEKN